MGRMRRAVLLAVLAGGAIVRAQTPQPPPSRPSAQGQPSAPPATAPAQPPASAADSQPTEAELWGIPVYPNSVFIRSYDAGRGQRYYIFGSTVPFADMVTYYRNVTKEKGNVVFEVPATHVFEVARYREETMAFPPSVTVKDYTFGGTGGYPNPRRGASPERFPTIVQIVPPPPGTVK